MQKVTCDKCSSEMPKARRDLGYKECVKCSTVEPYGHVHIFGSKTADTIQVLPAKVAAEANRYAKRSANGLLKVMMDRNY